jgi:DNA-binding XRE family transcriptional regulator
LTVAYTAERAGLLRAFGKRLCTVREYRNLSQDALTDLANIHRTHISALELGLRDPHLSMLLMSGEQIAGGDRYDPGYALRRARSCRHDGVRGGLVGQR